MTTLAPEWSGLAERYEAASSEQEREAILAETAQHERAEKTRQAAVRKRREDPVTNEWLDAAHAQYMQAEAQCAGQARAQRVSDHRCVGAVVGPGMARAQVELRKS